MDEMELFSELNTSVFSDLADSFSVVTNDVFINDDVISEVVSTGNAINPINTESISLSDEYVYWNAGNEPVSFVSDDGIISPTKMAAKKQKTDAGGGADFTFSFNDNGKLVGKLTLDKGLKNNEMDALGLGSEFAEKVKRFEEFFTSDENETSLGEFRNKEEHLAEYTMQEAMRTKGRYDRILKDVKKEKKQLKKEIKEKAENTGISSSSAGTGFEPFSDELGEAFGNNAENGILSKNQLIGLSNFNESFIPDYSIMSDEFEEIGDNISNTGELSRDMKAQIVSSSLIAKNKSKKTNDNINSYSGSPYSFNSQEKNDAASIGKDNGLSKVAAFNSFNNDGDKAPRAKDINNAKQSLNQRFMTDDEKLDQVKAKEKATKKQKNKELRKAAASAAFMATLNANRKMANEVGNMDYQSTGDLIKDGSSGLLSTVTDGLKKAGKSFGQEILKTMWRLVKSAIGFVMGLISLPMLGFFCSVVLIVLMFGTLIGSIFAVLGDDNDYDYINGENGTYNISVDSDGLYRGTKLSSEAINEIIRKLYETYPDFNYSQELVLRYGLSAVGCAYSQNSHWNHSDDIYDCSELAYLSYLAAGYYIDNQGYYSAAEECRYLVSNGYEISGSLKPGDLIFYGNANNGRYLGIYHVAIYLGNIDGVDKVVQAYSTKRGVIMSDVSTANIVSICRVI